MPGRQSGAPMEAAMANNLVVSYDLNNPGQNYEKVIAAVKDLGTLLWRKCARTRCRPMSASVSAEHGGLPSEWSPTKRGSYRPDKAN
jgi:hypothetical protein